MWQKLFFENIKYYLSNVKFFAPTATINDNVFAMPIFTESAEDKMTSMTIMLMMTMKIVKITLRKRNVRTMPTVDCIQFVIEDWGYVFVEKESTAFSRVAADVTVEENRMEYVTPIQENVPAAMTKKQAGERDVHLGQ